MLTERTEIDSFYHAVQQEKKTLRRETFILSSMLLLGSLKPHIAFSSTALGNISHTSLVCITTRI